MYESFSDWEACEQQSGDDASPPTTPRPTTRLSFVLVQEDEPSVVEPHPTSSPEPPPKRKSSTRPAPQVSKKRRTHIPTGRQPSRPIKSTHPHKRAHNAELDVSVPVYDYNNRIPRHSQTHSSPPRRSMDANLGLETEEAFAPKRTSSVAVKRARHRLSNVESFERPPSRGSTLPPSVPHVTLDAIETSASAQRTPEAALAAHHMPRSRVTAAPINHKSRTFRLSNASKTTNASEPNKTSVAPPKPDRAVGHTGRSHQRRHSAPVSGTPNQSTPAMHHTPHNRAHGVMEGQATAAGNKDSRRRNSLPDPAVSSQQIRIPFATSPPVVGGPSFHNPYAVPTIPQGGQLRFDPSNMNTLPANATKVNDHGVPNQHFAHGGSHLGQIPDERVHALPPETILQLSRFPHPPFLPMPPMTSMMGYQTQLPLQPDFLPQVPQMVVHPFLQSPAGNVYQHQSTHFNPAMNGVPVSCNPFAVHPPMASRPGRDGPSFPPQPVIPQTNLDGRPPNGDTVTLKTKRGSRKNVEKPRISSGSDDDVQPKAAGEDVRSKNNKKQAATKQQPKRTVESSLLEVDAIPCDEEEDGVDYVSCLNQIPQKKKFFVLLNPRFEQVRVRGKAESGWKCTMCVQLQNKSPHEFIETTTVSRNQKRAKKAAAKQLLSSLKSNVPELFSTEPSGKQNVQPIRSQTALNAINQLVREGHLPNQPSCDAEEVSERDEDRWRYNGTLVTKDHGRKVFAEYGSSKVNAKQKWARKALELLMELKSPGAEQYRYVIEPERLSPKKTFASIPKASEVIVRTSDDEHSDAPCDDIVNDMDQNLELPSDYELVVAKTELDCERWFEAHAQPGAELGAFIDSKLARLSVDESFTSEHDNDSEELIRPILCFSTANSCIVIRIGERQTCENEADLDHATDTFWVPEVVAKVLEDPRIQKAAVGGEDGLDLLFEYHGIQCESIQDIAVSSLAIAGYGRVGSSQDLSSLKDLTKYWMRKEAKAISWEGIWPRKRLLVERWLGSDDKEVALAVLSAYATLCVRERVCDAARVKRMNNPGAANDLEVLSRRIVEVGAG
ncbi:Double-stranded RNA-binding protein [Gracilaria domingensis]|nr:Double-stranded RNA-binding protein [Gracilaria domingensis]